MNRCHLLIAPALRAKDGVAYVPAEPSHLLWSLENHFVLINQELSIEKIGSIYSTEKW